jgi:hypothetical protein
MQYLFLFHGNNGDANAPQCYVIRTLIVLLRYDTCKDIQTKCNNSLTFSSSGCHKYNSSTKQRPHSPYFDAHYLVVSPIFVSCYMVVFWLWTFTVLPPSSPAVLTGRIASGRTAIVTPLPFSVHYTQATRT